MVYKCKIALMPDVFYRVFKILNKVDYFLVVVVILLLLSSSSSLLSGMDTRQSLIRSLEVCAAMLERLTLCAKSSAEHCR